MRPIYTHAALADAYADAVSRVFFCLKVRNQFAHCNWGDDIDAGLFFVDLTVSAETIDFEQRWKHIDPQLLEKHEYYFDGALEALRFTDHELAVKHGILQSHVWPKPPKLERPPLHNPESIYIPPWLDEDQKALHIARAQAAAGGAPTPTPQHLAMEAEREAKRTRPDRKSNTVRRSPPESP